MSITTGIDVLLIANIFNFHSIYFISQKKHLKRKTKIPILNIIISLILALNISINLLIQKFLCLWVKSNSTRRDWNTCKLEEKTGIQDISIGFFIHSFRYCVCMYVCLYVCTVMQTCEDQKITFRSLFPFPPCRYQDLNSGPQSWPICWVMLNFWTIVFSKGLWLLFQIYSMAFIPSQ